MERERDKMRQERAVPSCKLSISFLGYDVQLGAVRTVKVLRVCQSVSRNRVQCDNRLLGSLAGFLIFLLFSGGVGPGLGVGAFPGDHF
jgi:hypothetical protein